MHIAVITPVSGRHAHLRLQREGLRRSTAMVQHHVIVAMADPSAATMAKDEPPVMPLRVSVPDGRLPLARARNVGAKAAITAGADFLIFLDVDCIPSPGMIQRYLDCSTEDPVARLLCGPVAYLPPAPPGGYDLDRLGAIAQAHPARPCPREDQTIRGGDARLFWSLSFAMRTDHWRQVGGFCESYCGYGGEDTDFGQRAAAAGVRLDWIGGAWAYHQFHPSEDPPVQHLHDVLANANIFYQQWGWWPMSGWLHGFERLGLAEYDPARGWVSRVAH